MANQMKGWKNSYATVIANILHECTPMCLCREKLSVLGTLQSIAVLIFQGRESWEWIFRAGLEWSNSWAYICMQFPSLERVVLEQWRLVPAMACFHALEVKQKIDQERVGAALKERVHENLSRRGRQWHGCSSQGALQPLLWLLKFVIKGEETKLDDFKQWKISPQTSDVNLSNSYSNTLRAYILTQEKPVFVCLCKNK